MLSGFDDLSETEVLSGMIGPLSLQRQESPAKHGELPRCWATGGKGAINNPYHLLNVYQVLGYLLMFPFNPLKWLDSTLIYVFLIRKLRIKEVR